MYKSYEYVLHIWLISYINSKWAVNPITLLHQNSDMVLLKNWRPCEGSFSIRVSLMKAKECFVLSVRPFISCICIIFAKNGRHCDIQCVLLSLGRYMTSGPKAVNMDSCSFTVTLYEPISPLSFLSISVSAQDMTHVRNCQAQACQSSSNKTHWCPENHCMHKQTREKIHEAVWQTRVHIFCT